MSRIKRFSSLSAKMSLSFVDSLCQVNLMQFCMDLMVQVSRLNSVLHTVHVCVKYASWDALALTSMMWSRCVSKVASTVCFIDWIYESSPRD